MGFFDLKTTCGVCGKKIGLKKYKVKKSNEWICPECLKKAVDIMEVDLSKVTTKDIKQIITEKELKQEKRNISAINNPLSTAEGMYKYCIDNNFSVKWNKKQAVKQFKVIESNLMKNEKVYMTFIGLHNYNPEDMAGVKFVYAITNKRIMIGQKLPMTGENFQSISLKNINDITLQSGFVYATITIDTIKETFNVGLNKKSAKLLNSRIQEILDEIDNDKNKNSQSNSNTSFSVADELKKFKELLDMGVLTEEEFNTKKKDLLNL